MPKNPQNDRVCVLAATRKTPVAPTRVSTVQGRPAKVSPTYIFDGNI